MRILICDNDYTDLKKLEEKVHDYFKHHPERNYTVISYLDSAVLDFDIEDNGKADLYILDIDMPRIDGLTLSQKISDRYPYAAIFFYTSFLEYATEGYRVDAKRFILKEGDPSKFKEAMDFFCRFYDRFEQDCIVLRYYHDILKVPKKEIIYVEREKRILKIHTSNMGILYDNRGIQKLFDEIHDPGFLFVNRGIFVNVSYIQKTNSDEIVLFNGDKLYIGKKKIAEVKAAIMNCWYQSKEK